KTGASGTMFCLQRSVRSPQLIDQGGQLALSMHPQLFVDDEHLFTDSSHARLALRSDLFRRKAVGHLERHRSLGLGKTIAIVQELANAVTADIAAHHHQHLSGTSEQVGSLGYRQYLHYKRQVIAVMQQQTMSRCHRSSGLRVLGGPADSVVKLPRLADV